VGEKLSGWAHCTQHTEVVTIMPNMTNAVAHTDPETEKDREKRGLWEGTSLDRLTRKLHKYKRSRRTCETWRRLASNPGDGNPMQNLTRCTHPKPKPVGQMNLQEPRHRRLGFLGTKMQGH